MEHPSVTNVVVMQTVLDELKADNKAIQARVRALVDNKKRHFYVFSNEHHKETFVDREKTESLQERTDRGQSSWLPSCHLFLVSTLLLSTLVLFLLFVCFSHYPGRRLVPEAPFRQEDLGGFPLGHPVLS